MKNTGIQWATDTANPTSGCAGCELARPSLPENERVCYAYQVHMNRLRHSLPDLYAQSFFDVRLIPGRIAQYARGRDLRGAEKKDKPWLIEQGRNNGTSIFIKQLGAHAVGYNGSAQFKLKDSHGGDWSEWPDYLRVREFPTP